MTPARRMLLPLAAGHVGLALALAARPQASAVRRIAGVLDATPAVIVLVGVRRGTSVRVPLAAGTTADLVRAAALRTRSRTLAAISAGAAAGGLALLPVVK